MNASLSPYAQIILRDVQKIATNKRDRRPGMPVSELPLGCTELAELLDAGVIRLETRISSVSGGRINYIVPTEG